MMNIKRELYTDEIRLLINGHDTTLHISDPFFLRFPSTEIIRIDQPEYETIPEAGNLFTHFNIDVSGHKVGETYLLPLIVRHGRFDSETEVLPLLSFDHAPYATCTDVRESIRYEDLTETDFEYSPPHIKNREELKQVILDRYSKSMPHLSQDEILSLGVSKTTLRILGRS